MKGRRRFGDSQVGCNIEFNVLKSFDVFGNYDKDNDDIKQSEIVQQSPFVIHH